MKSRDVAHQIALFYDMYDSYSSAAPTREWMQDVSHMCN